MGFPQEFPPKTNAIIIVLYYPSEQLIKQTIFSVGEPISGAIICSGSMEKAGQTPYNRGGHGSVYISKVSHFTFVWLVSKNLGLG